MIRQWLGPKFILKYIPPEVITEQNQKKLPMTTSLNSKKKNGNENDPGRYAAGIVSKNLFQLKGYALTRMPGPMVEVSVIVRISRPLRPSGLSFVSVSRKTVKFSSSACAVNECFPII